MSRRRPHPGSGDDAAAARDRLGRRAFLSGGAAAAGGAVAALGGRAAWAAGQEPQAAPAPEPDATGQVRHPFRGVRQAGVATPPQSVVALVALDLVDGVDREALLRVMTIWTDDVERLVDGRPGLTDTEPELAAVPAALTVTVGYGPGVFTAAGLEDQRPAWLAPLPAFTHDRLDEAYCGGDLLLQVCADDEVAVSHAVRLLVKEARTYTRVRWVQRGFRRTPGTTAPGTTMRNLMGQVDGTRNLEPGRDDDLVWHGDGSPAWLVGGTSLVVRRIAMHLDTWDELDHRTRDVVMGRRQSDGSPLTGTREHDEPDLEATDELGLPAIDVAAHIRRSRTDDPTQRFLRRAYNYDEAPPPGQLSDSGLLFLTYQRDVLHQFVPVQQQLDEGDRLNQWTTAVGSAVFAVPGGVGPGEVLGERLLGP